MKCGKCKSTDCRLSHRNPLERVISNMIPIRPYRCENCSRRFFWLTRPLFNLSRALVAAVFGLLIVYFAANLLIKSREAAPIKPESPEPEQTVEESATRAGDAATDQSGPASEAAVAETSQDEDAATEEAGGVPAPETTSPAEEVVEEPSDFVKDQLERNKKKAGEGGDPSKAAAPERDAVPTVEARTPSRAPVQNKTRAVLSGFDYEAASSSFSLQLIADKPIDQYRHMRLSNPERLVIDLPGQWRIDRGVRLKTAVDNEIIGLIRIGRHENKLRIVLDLKTAQVSPPEFAKGVESLRILISKR